MPINRVAFSLLALVSVTAAAGGAYLATRHNQAATVPLPPAVEAQPIPDASGTVTETETILDETPAVIPVVEVPLAIEPPVATPAARRTPVRAPAAARAPERPPSVPAAAAPSARVSDRGASAPVSSPDSDRGDVDRSSAPEPAPAPPVAAAPAVIVPVLEESPPPLPEKTLVELSVPADSVLGLQIETSVTSEKAKVEDKVEARVTRDVKVGDEIAIPAGSRVEGSVTLVEKGGKVKERARLGIRFHTLVLADGTRVRLNTETVYRDGVSPAGESTAKIGGAAIGGAILGAIMGGGKGATIGGAVGAAGGTAAVMASDRNAATLPAGSTVTVRVLSPVTVTLEQ